MLLCSDGLSDEVSDAQMAEIFCDEQLNNQQMADTLVEAALRNGGRDNVTVIVVSLE